NAEDDIANRKSHHELEHEAQHENGEPHHHDHDHNAFKSISIDLSEVSDIEQFEQAIGALISEHKILRLKGFVAVKNKDMRYVLQAVGPRIEGYFDRMWEMGEKKQSRLVVISDAKFNEDKVTEQLKQIAVL
ncbi:MAG: GTP-binding protein, partial [Rhizobiales bacterium]|nr:GTP-binding protein [Hyphomicrobiales bacterium]